jgi:hypothetical protein
MYVQALSSTEHNSARSVVLMTFDAQQVQGHVQPAGAPRVSSAGGSKTCQSS